MLYARARELADVTDSRAALPKWLSSVTAYAATVRGLDRADPRQSCRLRRAASVSCAEVQLTEAGEPLLRRE
ncbi:hypothetical protein [Micromonospora peucetia]|uniref:Uncharacterized protein n=1 Tax=Micromonospora peucetia TaxID=47871 RepID=A0ABZ1E906_9ACTN|nr:hypothetical protein [Micromonospora peucetia]WSA31298.1 hypothetical protein OIE14_24640 [Micromonospora peucetia]